ncbi:MAG: methyltransferase family protein [Gemmatimonadetes bacterium]|jgi:SAM-dependent methyltransferase|nr:methyltransferase family protein [Gemmatimonadota bacterium]
MDAGYGARYRELFERHWWWRARERVILGALARHRPASGWSTVLDVGCGDGLFFDALGALDGVTLVEGVEPAAALVSPGGPHRSRIHVAPFDASFDTDRRYSLVLMLDVLEHLPDPGAALRHATSLLAPDGVFVATVPAFMSLWTRHDALNHHLTRYTRRSMAELARAGTLRIDESRYFFHWTAAAKLVQRVAERLVPGEPAAPSVPPAPLNRALYALSRLEEGLLGRLPVPFGSSLLVVGRRAAGV